MAGYYQRLEAQLARATTCGVPRRRLALPWIVRQRAELHPRVHWLPGALALAVTVAVALVFLNVGSERAHAPVRPPVTARPGAGGLPMIRNYAPDKPPALGGQPFCDATLHASGGAASPAGTVLVDTRPPTGYVYLVRASGLLPPARGEVYELWLRPENTTTAGAHQLLPSQPPVVLGVIKPAVGPDGMLAAEGLVPPSLTIGPYRFLITVQPPSLKAPGRPVLAGDASL